MPLDKDDLEIINLIMNNSAIGSEDVIRGIIILAAAESVGISTNRFYSLIDKKYPWHSDQFHDTMDALRLLILDKEPVE